MNQHTRNLLALALVANSAWFATPTIAQTPVKSNNEKPNTIIIPGSNESPVVADTTILSTPTNSTDSTNNKPLEEAKAVPAPKSNLRIPISSRVFAAPSMQQ